MKRALILGAGVQGVCAAFALRRRGFAVAIADEEPDCLQRASLANEGKIHLGFVYANDRSLETSLLMLDGALSFAPLIEEWLGHSIEWNALCSRRYSYVVTSNSMLSSDDLLDVYARLDAEYQEQRRAGRVRYLGDTPSRLWQPCPSGVAALEGRFVSTTVQTAEIALKVDEFRCLLRDHLHAAASIETLYGHTVDGVRRTETGFRVEGHTADGRRWRRGADIVVNCLWTGRLSVDRQLGIDPPRPWVYRLKHRLSARLPEPLLGLPSLTFVLGPFGDVVVYDDGRVNLSWYPECMRGWSTDVSPPSDWDGPCRAQADTSELVRSTLAAFDERVPGLGASTVERVHAGVIFAWGTKDIHAPDSELHRRREIGVEAHDGYFSINTGKFTCAPLFAAHLLDALS